MTFTYQFNTQQPLARDYYNADYALFRVRQISRDTRENPPFSMSDEEWLEFLYDTKLKVYENKYMFQPYKAVYRALSTNPERLRALSEASGSYTYVDLETVKKELLEAQRELNLSLGVSPSTSVSSFMSVPVIREW